MLARAGISLVPYLGGAAKELLAFYLVPPLERRRTDWMNAVAEELKDLHTKVEGFRLEKLKDNSLFITVFTQAFQIAMRNHQKEKLEALRNAVINCARGIDIEENLQLLFLERIDSFTPLHLRILAYFSDPTRFMVAAAKKRRADYGDFFGQLKEESASMEQALDHLLFQDWGTHMQDAYGPIVQDLYSRGLVRIDGTDLDRPIPYDTISYELRIKRTTTLGDQFLRYISPQDVSKTKTP
jgi:hypothetical protein